MDTLDKWRDAEIRALKEILIDNSMVTHEQFKALTKKHYGLAMIHYDKENPFYALSESLPAQAGYKPPSKLNAGFDKQRQKLTEDIPSK